MSNETKVSQQFIKEVWDKDTSKYKKRAVERFKQPIYPGLFSQIERNEDGKVKDKGKEAPQ